MPLCCWSLPDLDPDPFRLISMLILVAEAPGSSRCWASSVLCNLDIFKSMIIKGRISDVTSLLNPNRSARPLPFCVTGAEPQSCFLIGWWGFRKLHL